MANKVITMQQIRSIIQLLEKGYSLRSISAEIGLSRQPVTFYAARLRNAPYSLEALRQLSDEDLAAIVYAPAVSTSFKPKVTLPTTPFHKKSRYRSLQQLNFV